MAAHDGEPDGEPNLYSREDFFGDTSTGATEEAKPPTGPDTAPSFERSKRTK